MNNTTHASIHAVLHRRRDIIAQRWYRAIVHTGFASMAGPAVQAHLAVLTDQVIALLLAESCPPAQAQALGAALVQLHYSTPDAIGSTQEVLAVQLMEDLPAAHAAMLYPRVAVLLGHLATGFFRQACATILAEQEQIRAALLTERNRVEVALRHSEASLAEAQRVAHVGHWEYDVVHNVLQWSDEIYRIFGLTPQEFGATRDAFLNAVHPDDRAAVATAVQTAVQGTPFSIEHRIVRPSGEIRIVHEQVEILDDDVGRPGRMIGTVHDITERKQAEQELAQLAFHDPLTQLPNRAQFMTHLQRAWRHQRAVAVLFLDVDNFKVINDSLGHQNGDHVLVAVGQRLRSCTRPEDIVARLGGDEFIILLEDITAVHDATQVAERILAALRAPIPLRGREVYITTSIGIVFNGCGIEEPDSLVRDADIALYRAKAAGKAQYVVFESSMNAQAVERLELETDLHGALERHDFRIYYQPIVCLETHRIVEVEALLHWPDPRRGLLTPEQFIPLAEETGLIVPLGEWVLRTACTQTKAWHDVGFPLRVAVNLSPRQVQHTDVAMLLGTILADTGLPAAFLTVELTESGVMDQLDVARRVLQAVHALGVQVALDDFGMGSSALTYLTRLPVTRVKLSHTFVQHVTTDGQQAALARGILALAQSLRLSVTAEGIETVDQMHFFQAAQADALQGYLVGRPMAAEDLPAYLAQAGPGIAALLRGVDDGGPNRLA